MLSFLVTRCRIDLMMGVSSGLDVMHHQELKTLYPPVEISLVDGGDLVKPVEVSLFGGHIGIYVKRAGIVTGKLHEEIKLFFGCDFTVDTFQHFGSCDDAVVQSTRLYMALERLRET